MKITSGKELPATFEDLTRELYSLRPIRNEKDHERAQMAVDQLSGRTDLTKDQKDYLDTLSTLMERYEEEHHAIDTSDLDPMETLKFLLEENGMNANDLGEILGQRQLGSKILRGERNLSKSHIVRLSRHFRVNPAVFLKGAFSR